MPLLSAQEDLEAPWHAKEAQHWCCTVRLCKIPKAVVLRRRWRKPLRLRESTGAKVGGFIVVETKRSSPFRACMLLHNPNYFDKKKN